MLALAPFSHHDAVWQGDSLGDTESVQSSGFGALDAELPGGGWPIGAMVELLQPDAGWCEWQVLLPALAARTAVLGAPTVLVGAPHPPMSQALAARGLPPEALVWVRSDATAARLWACEQALRCRDLAAVVAWLPQARVGDLRRLQLAAAQHDALLFVCRPAAEAQTASPARLRIVVEPSATDAALLELHIAKRRGPPLAAPVALPARDARLQAVLAASRQRRAARNRAVPPREPQAAATNLVHLATVRLPATELAHALDGTRLAAA